MMMRSAPFCFAAITAQRPTAPSPTIATVLPGCTLAASAPNQPVPSTSEVASRLGMRSSDGRSGVAQGAVGERDAQEGRLRALRTHGPAVHAAALVARPADRAGI